MTMGAMSAPQNNQQHLQQERGDVKRAMNEKSVYYIGSLSSLIHEKKSLDDKSEHTRGSRRSRSVRKCTPDDSVKTDSLLKGEKNDGDDDEDSVYLDPANLQSESSQSQRYDSTTVKVTEDLADFSIVSEIKTHEDDSGSLTGSSGGTREANKDGKTEGEDEDQSTASGGNIRRETSTSDEKRERKRRDRKKGGDDASVGTKSRRSDHSSSRKRIQADESKRRHKGDGDASVVSRVRSSGSSTASHRNKSEDAKRRDRKRREEKRAEMDDSDYSITSHATNTTERNPRGRARGTSSGGRTMRNDRKNLDKTGSFDDDMSVSSYATTRSRDVSVSGRTGRRDRQRRYPNMGDDDSSVASQLSRVSHLSTANQIPRSAQRTRSQSRSSSKSRGPRHVAMTRSKVTTRPQYSDRHVVDSVQGTSPADDDRETIGAESNTLGNASNIIDPLESDDKIEEALCDDGQDPENKNQDSWKNDLDETEGVMGEPLSLTEQAKGSQDNGNDSEPPKSKSPRKKMSKKNKRRLAKCILLFFTLAGVALGVLFMLPSLSKKESPPKGQNTTAIVAQPTLAPSSLRGSSTFVPVVAGEPSNTTSAVSEAISSLAPIQTTTAPSLRPSTFAPTIRLTIAPSPQPIMPSTPMPTLAAFGVSEPVATVLPSDISVTGTPVFVAPVSMAVPFSITAVVSLAPTTPMTVVLAPTTVSPTVVQGTDGPTMGSVSLPTVKLGPPPTPVSSSAGDVPSLFATSSSVAPAL